MPRYLLGSTKMISINYLKSFVPMSYQNVNCGGVNLDDDLEYLQDKFFTVKMNFGWNVDTDFINTEKRSGLYLDALEKQLDYLEEQEKNKKTKRRRL